MYVAYTVLYQSSFVCMIIAPHACTALRCQLAPQLRIPILSTSLRLALLVCLVPDQQLCSFVTSVN